MYRYIYRGCKNHSYEYSEPLQVEGCVYLYTHVCIDIYIYRGCKNHSYEYSEPLQVEGFIGGAPIVVSVLVLNMFVPSTHIVQGCAAMPLCRSPTPESSIADSNQLPPSPCPRKLKPRTRHHHAGLHLHLQMTYLPPNRDIEAFIGCPSQPY